MTYIKKKSQKQERRTAKDFGGREQVASGALWGAKGDVRTGGQRTSSFNETDFLIENKFTDKQYYKLEKKIWEKIKGEAIQDNFRIPLMQIDILDDLELIVIDLNDYKGFKLEEHMQVHEREVTVYKKSYRIEHDKMIGLGVYADQHQLTPVQIVNMEVGKPERLILMRKDDFLYVWDKVEK